MVLDPDPADARAVLARRTEHGEQVRRLIRRGIAEVEATWEAEVGAERYATFRAVLDELAGLSEPDDRA